jgi:peptidoglycan/LPS O-acetylase OafA/YrhL
MQDRTNRFDFLRLLFAGMVFVFHAVALSSFANTNAEALLGRLAEISIQGFFIISGMLVYGSLNNSKNIADFAAKRIRRLYPAYMVVILTPALISLMLGGAPLHVGKYVAANLAFLNFLQPTLPGLFEGQRFPVVNGALWTLKIEVMFYMALPILGWVLAKAGQARFKMANWGLLVLIYIVAEIWRSVVPHLDIPHAAQIARQLPGQMSFFVTGMVLWMLKDNLQNRIGLIGILGVGVLAASFLPALEFLRAAGLGGLVFVLAYGPGPKLNAARFGDLSYGVYITHFPIINGLIAVGVFASAPWTAMGLAALLVFAISWLLWHSVEKPALRMNSYYRMVGRTKR